MDLYIGLMSGTSADGIDAALVDFCDDQAKLIASYHHPYPSHLRQNILELCHPGQDEINRMGNLEVLLGKSFAATVNELLKQSAIQPTAVRAIGSHGQTIRHHPQKQFTLQIGDPNIIAAETGITTIADFRRRDMAYGGQGAPLVPAFHHHLFATPHQKRIIVNIGGIANITLLDNSNSVLGFDTGPGNTLLDLWIEKHCALPFDENGKWASLGKVNSVLLKQLLEDPFFKLKGPKSTGKEYFNLPWLERYITETMTPEDVQATLVELTVQSIIQAIPFNEGEIIICGGGAYNDFLMSRMIMTAKNFKVISSQELGLPPRWIEAMAFAWLAKQTLEKKSGNLISVTGAKNQTILGGIYYI